MKVYTRGIPIAVGVIIFFNEFWDGVPFSDALGIGGTAWAMMRIASAVIEVICGIIWWCQYKAGYYPDDE